ncbi:MAG: Rrf2 family transcriptional regulator [Bdellovibrionales bacterium]|nr:Rrf2 family transcriptional regulator [Bdellovibrionales bacterium]
MIKLNRKLEYATIALKHMKDKYPGQLTSAKEVSETYSLPFDVTAKTLQVMAKHGLLKSVQGPEGGYQIVKDLMKVSLLDLIQIIEGPIDFAKCLGPSGCEIDSTCNIKSSMSLLKSKLFELYRGLSLWDLLTPNATQTRTPANPAVRSAAHQAELEIESLR